MKKLVVITSGLLLGFVALNAHGSNEHMQKGAMKNGMKMSHMKKATPTKIKGWSSKSKIAQGKKIFTKNCAICHGKNAQGLGGFPALNGTGHVAHHAPSKLLAQITNGGGGMPPFKGKLSKAERESALIYLHSLWPKKVKEHYDKMFSIKD